MLSLIVAKSKNNVIGVNNTLPWHISDDLKRFKELTTNHTIIMGRKTFDSLGRVLPKRKHIVLTSNMEFTVDNEMVEVAHSTEEILSMISSSEENFIIGGASLYKLMLDKVDRMYITEIDSDIEGDTYFPNFNLEDWKIIEKIDKFDEKSNLKYSFVTYERI